MRSLQVDYADYYYYYDATSISSFDVPAVSTLRSQQDQSTSSPIMTFTTLPLLPPLTMLLLLYTPPIYAWGALGHMTIGYITQSFLLPSTTTFSQSLLSIHNTSYLASIAPWADH